MIIQTISIKSVTAQGMGTLSVFEGSHDVPFDIKRIYYIHGAPKGTHRGGHAHKALRQVLWCPYGSIRIRLDNGREKADVLLDSPDKGLIVEHYMWREMIWAPAGPEGLNLATARNISDYIRLSPPPPAGGAPSQRGPGLQQHSEIRIGHGEGAA